MHSIPTPRLSALGCCGCCGCVAGCQSKGHTSCCNSRIPARLIGWRTNKEKRTAFSHIFHLRQHNTAHSDPYTVAPHFPTDQPRTTRSSQSLPSFTLILLSTRVQSSTAHSSNQLSRLRFNQQQVCCPTCRFGAAPICC